MPPPVVVTAPFIIPLSTAPSQRVTATLGSQSCTITVYTKSINVPVENNQQDTPQPPVYENRNPVFLDLYVGTAPIVTGVIVRNGCLIVMNAYLGFVGDLSLIDTSGLFEDPFGVPARLPPPWLRNSWQRAIPYSVSENEYAPAAVANTIPGLGVRWVLTYWKNLR